ncbi:hypothetical protein DL98DRAFT_621278, partial [Cadophora sp. DSE1049]
YYVYALSPLQHLLAEADTWTGSEGVLRRMKALTCVLQFVCLEVFSNSSGNWSFHLKAADALLSSLVETRTKYLAQGSPDNSERELQDQGYLFYDDHLVIEFLLGAFTWLDIIAQISIRAKPSSHFDIQIVLENCNIKLEHLFGCQNWALLLILEASKLDDWKRECEKNRRLSVAELVRRGTKIETENNQGLAILDSHRPSQRQIDSSIATEAKILVVAECFALAAMTYIHVVVSGPHPDLPELQDSVSRGMGVLRTLADQKLLSRVVWPVCDIGCMMSESTQELFRTLVAAEDAADTAVRTFSRAMEIIEHCWKTRHDEAGNVEWFSAMRSVGQHILLL